MDGELTLDKPDIRSGSFETTVFDKYSTVEKALDSVIVESYINGVSTRSVNNIINNLGVNVSPEYVSSLNKDLDAKVKEFLETRIEEQIRYLYIDATYFKVRKNSKYRSMALYVSIGVNSNGIRQILSMDVYTFRNFFIIYFSLEHTRHNNLVDFRLEIFETAPCVEIVQLLFRIS